MADKITRKELSPGVRSELDKSGRLDELTTVDKTSLVGAINEVNAKEVDLTPINNKIDTHKADYMYQIPSFVGTQIRINKLSGTNRLYFKLDNDLTGDITISLDNGVTEKPVNDFEGIQLTELEKGFVEVIADATFFTLRNRGGLSKVDRLALIDIVNVAEENETFIKTDIVNKINQVDSGDKFELLAPNSPWIDIQSAIPLISTGKKWATGVGFSDAFGYVVNVTGLEFTPSIVFLTLNHDNGTGFPPDMRTKVIYVDFSFIGVDMTINIITDSNASIIREKTTITEDGFTCKVTMPSKSEEYSWIAIE